MDNSYAQKKLIHNFFEITVFIKGVGGVLEIIIGVLFLFFKQETIYDAIISLTDYNIIKNSGDFAVGYLTNTANNFSLSTQYFIAVYFLFYGAVNMFLVVSLLMGKLWAYPTAVLFFVLFTAYMLLRFLFRPSGILFFFIVFDIALIAMIWLEYKRVARRMLNNYSN